MKKAKNNFIKYNSLVRSRHLIKREYLTRLWIIQYLLAARIVLCCGSESNHEPVFSVALQYTCAALISSLTSRRMGFLVTFLASTSMFSLRNSSPCAGATRKFTCTLCVLLFVFIVNLRPCKIWQYWQFYYDANLIVAIRNLSNRFSLNFETHIQIDHSKCSHVKKSHRLSTKARALGKYTDLSIPLPLRILESRSVTTYCPVSVQFTQLLNFGRRMKQAMWFCHSPWICISHCGRWWHLVRNICVTQRDVGILKLMRMFWTRERVVGPRM